MPVPHPDPDSRSVACAVVTVSDTRTPQTDRSGRLIQQLLQASSHHIVDYRLVKDEPQQIQPLLQTLGETAEAIIFTGGTGIAPRDTTYDAIAPLLNKALPGFGELFRQLSYAEIGSRAMASRATAGTYGSTLVFVLPGSSNAVRLAMEALILPELQHLTSQIQGKR